MWKRLEYRITLEVHINIVCPSVVVLQVWSQEHPYEHQNLLIPAPAHPGEASTSWVCQQLFWYTLRFENFLPIELSLSSSSPEVPPLLQLQGLSDRDFPSAWGQGRALFSLESLVDREVQICKLKNARSYWTWEEVIQGMIISEYLQSGEEWPFKNMYNTYNILYWFLFTSGGAWKPQELFLVSGVCTLQSQLGQCALRCLESQSPSRNPEHGCLSAFHDDFAGKGSSVGRSNSKSGELWSAVAS